MRLATYRVEESSRVGLVLGNWIFDLVETCNHTTIPAIETSALERTLESGGMLGALEKEAVLRVACKVAAFSQNLVEKGIPDNLIGSAVHRKEDIRLMAPIPRPKKNIVCLGLNYKDHWAETFGKRGEPPPSIPVFFTKAPTTVIGPFDDVVYPASTKELDYEVELAFVIGKLGKNIARKDAYGHIAGYTIMNDITARDLQRSHGQWFRGKSLDTFAPFGPCLVTKDEVPNPQKLDVQLKVNDEIRQRSNTANMIFKIDQIVEILSSDMTLEPGDIIATGTPAGIGGGMTPPNYLKPGDTVETEIECLGTIRNKIIAGY